MPSENSLAGEDDAMRGWKTASLVCRMCGHRHQSVYPADIVDEERQECPECGHMTCGPEETTDE